MTGAEFLSFMESIIEIGLEEPVTCLLLNSALKQISKQAKQKHQANNMHTMYGSLTKALQQTKRQPKVRSLSC